MAVKVKKGDFKPIPGSPTLKQVQASVANNEKPLAPTLPVIQPPIINPAKDNTPKVYRDPRTGNLSGVEINGKSFFGLSPDEVNTIIAKENERNATPQGAVEMSGFAKQQESNQQISQIGQLTPEQQTIAQGSTDIDMPLDRNIANQRLKEGGAAGAIALGAGIAGAVAAPFTAGASIPIAAGIGAAALGSGIYGATTIAKAFTGGEFEMYKHQAEEKTSYVNTNINAAKANIRRAITLANKGGDSATAVEQYNNAYAKLLLAERQLKVLSKDTYEYTTNAGEDWRALNNYMQGTLPMQQQQLAIALQKPDPAYVDYEVMAANQNE